MATRKGVIKIDKGLYWTSLLDNVCIGHPTAPRHDHGTGMEVAQKRHGSRMELAPKWHGSGTELARNRHGTNTELAEAMLRSSSPLVV